MAKGNINQISGCQSFIKYFYSMNCMHNKDNNDNNIHVVLILTGLNSALCCEKQIELYRDRQKEILHFLL